MILNGNSTHIGPIQASRNWKSEHTAQALKNTQADWHIGLTACEIIPRGWGGGGVYWPLDPYTGCEFWENNTEDYSKLKYSLLCYHGYVTVGTCKQNS